MRSIQADKGMDPAGADPGSVAAIVQCLEEEIALGILRPRERLVEEELLGRFECKRHVIRQVLVELELMGIVDRPPNRGALVRDISLEEIDDIYFMRELLERTAVELMPLPADPVVVQTLTALHDRHGRAAEAGRLREVFRLNIEFHQVFFAACGNRQLSDAIQQFAFKAHAIRSYTIGDPALLARVREEHARMIKLLRGSQREALLKVVTAHKQPARQAYLATSRTMLLREAPLGRAMTPARPVAAQEKRASGSGVSPGRARKSRSQPSSA